jgi:hypothetical protein
MIMLYDGNKYLLIESEDVSQPIVTESIPILKIKGMCLKCFSLEVLPSVGPDGATSYLTLNPSALINHNITTVFFSGLNIVWVKDVPIESEIYQGFLQKFYTQYQGYLKQLETAKQVAQQPEVVIPQPVPQPQPMPAQAPQPTAPYQTNWAPQQPMPQKAPDPIPHV